MSYSTRMNVFLQKMLKKSDEETSDSDGDSIKTNKSEKKQQVSPPATIRPAWIRRLGVSPKKYDRPTLKAPEINKKILKTVEMPDLETLIREFETGFMSPRKVNQVDGDNVPGSFVKKIVAAYEVKYKAYDELRAEEEAAVAAAAADAANQATHEKPKSPSSGGLSSLLGSSSPFERKLSKLKTKNLPRKISFSRKDHIFTPKLKKERMKDENDNNKSVIYSTPNDPGPESKLRRRSDRFSSPFKSTTDETKSIVSIDLSVTSYDDNNDDDDDDDDDNGDDDDDDDELDETLKLLDNEDLEEYSTMPINIEKQSPKIVGAFLKNPIEIEETAVDWIPITGKKLPRKRSLKKLLSSLTGRKTSKTESSIKHMSKEETRELQDSGYDEKSSSSSSLTSLISISDALLQQETSYVVPARRATYLTSFSPNHDKFPTVQQHRQQKDKKKLLLTEVPRESLKVDLGPCYPTPLHVITMSLDRKPVASANPPRQGTKAASNPPIITTIPKQPKLSKLPKLSSIKGKKKTDDGDTVVRIRNKMYEVEFHRSCNDLSITSSKISAGDYSFESMYDVPRKFLSKSEPGLPKICGSFDNKFHEPIYDVPKPGIPSRPKSSNFEDSWSLRRRTATFTVSSMPDFYALPPDDVDDDNFNEEPHYATVKPRYRRAYLNREV
ncbi:uncharacterized protein [Prorops nasuta]|uniref:uncharacterized protein isoform X2 n=1 Tax=Prorops nasuta TaxID=863751 RepID=UPI0034CFEE66